LFKNAANVSLRGNTFDATHMDKFLGSNFGDRSFMQESSPGRMSNRTIGPGGGGGSNLLSYLASNSNTIRPSVSFMGMNRSEYKQTKYTDEQDGPSPMQILGHEKAFKDLSIGSPTYYEKDRETHLDSVSNNT
jgi:hypothetical protein